MFLCVLCCVVLCVCVVFFQAEDGIRDLVRSRGLGDVYKRQHQRQQHRLAGAGRSDDKGMAYVADMKGQPERGRSFGSAVKQLSLIHI